MRDEWFIRGKVPMTKCEVRAVSLEKLELFDHAVCYDIGAGTGSVAIEMAAAVPSGHVYAIEKKDEALDLIRQNQKKFNCSNMTVIGGSAPQVLKELPAPTHVFIGGTSGELKPILDVLFKKNKKVRVVMNVIALESLVSVCQCLEELRLEADIVTVQVSKADHVGSYHLMRGQNPVTIISFGGEEEIDEEADS